MPDGLLSSDPRAIALGVVSIVVGQILNFAVFRRLGHVGVFYGARFGLDVPWVTGFPFSVLAHPQYVGTTLTIWGLFIAVRFPHDDWAVLPLLETLYYYLGAQIEAAVPQPSSGSILSPRTKR
jgi:methylene-fatty-acyl-phospholipid synthase